MILVAEICGNGQWQRNLMIITVYCILWMSYIVLNGLRESDVLDCQHEADDGSMWEAFEWEGEGVWHEVCFHRLNLCRPRAGLLCPIPACRRCCLLGIAVIMILNIDRWWVMCRVVCYLSVSRLM